MDEADNEKTDVEAADFDRRSSLEADHSMRTDDDVVLTEVEDVWQDLTDDILLHILSFLDAVSLCTAAATCRNWYRVAEDETLWRRLVFSKLGKKTATLPGGKSWRSEYERLTDCTPTILSDEAIGHEDEIYHVSFSSSGRYLSTTGHDASLRVWNFGYPTTLYAERTDLQGDNLLYTRYSEFNESETLILVSGLSFFAGGCTVIIFSVKPDLPAIHAVRGGNANFRGAWLSDDSFLNGNYCNTGFMIHQHTVNKMENRKRRIKDLLDHPDLWDTVMVVTPRSSSNDFIKVVSLPRVQASKRNDGELCSDSDTDNQTKELQKYIILSHSKNSAIEDNHIGIYPLSLSEDGQSYTHSGEKVEANLDNPGGMVGLSLSADQRFLTYNHRKAVTDSERYGEYEEAIDLHMFDLHNMRHTEELYSAHKANGRGHLSYIFPAVCDDYVASGSEHAKAYIWDRHYGTLLSELSHSTSPGNSGVNAAVFHPKNCEILVTVADDRKVKIWRSKRLIREHDNCQKTLDSSALQNLNCDSDLEEFFSDDETVSCCAMKKKPKIKNTHHMPLSL